jgi:outer membrane receptor for Fe3+-dicitrate
MSVGSFQGYPLADELLAPEDRAESFGHLVELAYKTGALKIFTQAGMLSEKNSFLGSRSEGAFDLESGTQTSFAGVNTAYRMTPHWSLVGSYYRGISNPQVDSNSLFNDISDVQTESFSVGMMGQDIVHEGDSLGILGNQPLRVTGGEASLSLASGRSRSGLLYKQDYEVNLAPTGRELNMEAFYHFNLPQTQTQLMSSLMYRTEPGHIEAAPDEGLFLLQLQQPF